MTFDTLTSRASEQIGGMLDGLTTEDQERLVRAMETVHTILEPRTVNDSRVVVRGHRSGDIGWIVERHGVLYAQEYNWDDTFEGLVADIMSVVIKNYDHRKDHVWIAEIDGERVGSIVLRHKDKSTSQLHLFLVESWARGHGIGKLLLDECVRFAANAGYEIIELWTQSILTAARRLYERAGFRLTKTESHHSFGHDLTGETWELKLR
jgi:ribosomal protein S18 acetylase RimI-like enzyme